VSQTETERDAAQEVARLRLLLSSVVIVASVIVIIIGLQGHEANKKATGAADTAKALAAATTARAACLNAWAEKFTEVTRDRVEQRGRLDEAKKAHDAAVDDVLGVFVKAIAHPQDQAFQDSLLPEFEKALTAYDAATRHLRRVEARSQHLADSGDYPRLDC
jgi:hypothetical protein